MFVNSGTAAPAEFAVTAVHAAVCTAGSCTMPARASTCDTHAIPAPSTTGTYSSKDLGSLW